MESSNFDWMLIVRYNNRIMIILVINSEIFIIKMHYIKDIF